MSNNDTSVETYQIQLHDQSAPLEKLGIPSDIMTADYILTTDWPEPIWAVPEILPVGFAILAGAPKVGKSWLALQIAQAVATGGDVLGQKVEKGPVLYLALEDSPRRLKDRMNKQKWPRGLEVDFITIGGFPRIIGDLRNDGRKKLAELIESRSYRLIVVDTLSRSIKGDQNDVAVMTSGLTAVQEIAHKYNCTILIVDHHKKGKGEAQDVIGDILGSTAKGAMTDTVLGLYRERGKPGAKLSITGREVDEKTIELFFDWETGCWQRDTKNTGVTQQQSNLLAILLKKGPASGSKIAKAVGRNRGSVQKQLIELEKNGKVMQVEKIWKVVEIHDA